MHSVHIRLNRSQGAFDGGLTIDHTPENDMKLVNLKTALAISALALFGSSAHAVLPHEVKCANGQTLEVPDSVTAWEACLTIGSTPANGTYAPANTKYSAVKLNRAADQTRKRDAADPKKATMYRNLAAKYKPRTPEQTKLIREYMRLPASQRNAFEAAHPGETADFWDYGPYAVCFYASVAGGGDIVEAGDECRADWVD